MKEHEVFRGRLIQVRVEAGHEIVQHPAGAAIVAVEEDGRVWLVRQSRPAVGQALLELPAGVRNQGEVGPATARRELGEEVGLEAALLERLAEFYSSPGFTDEVIEVYLATGLTPTRDQSADPGEVIDEAITVPLEEAYRMCVGGEIRDAKTIIGLALARERLRVGPRD